MQDTRLSVFTSLFPEAKPYRVTQIKQSFFVPTIRSWNQVTTLSKIDRERVGQSVPFLSLSQASLLRSPSKDTYKALLLLHDGLKIETVLMKNARGHWTICVSTQVGCAMKCTFCATGSMGLSRNLSEDEIVDQYRFWLWFLYDKNPEEQITNIVYMGMGEPLANYDAVKDSLLTLLKQTTIGPTHMTVSTIGSSVLLQKIIEDPSWPSVRMAISLHSAVLSTRKSIVPTMADSFYKDLQTWCEQYREKFASRSLYVTFEYVLLGGINDSVAEARALALFLELLGTVKVNLIPWNPVTTGSAFKAPTSEVMDSFHTTLQAHNVITIRRKTMGLDIDAACGQLVIKNIQ
jgi:adenine C2-methylase RlmN of 23S rRNA A2503 and tRNA A37